VNPTPATVHTTTFLRQPPKVFRIEDAYVIDFGGFNIYCTPAQWDKIDRDVRAGITREQQPA
jgi:hypothetical protein